MKVILLKDVKGVGKKGELIEAKDGYARNYLLPRKLGEEANSSKLKEIKDKENSDEFKYEQEKSEAQKLADKLSETTIKIKTKVGENNKLFGSITSKEISELIEKQENVKIDKRKIELPEGNIKTAGTTTAKIKVFKGIVANLKISIVEE